MTVINTQTEYCSKCNRLKFYIAFKPSSKIKLQCIVCDKPKK